MLNTIIIFIVSVIFTIYTLRLIESVDEKFSFTSLIIMLLCLGIIVQCKFYTNPSPQKIADAYSRGFNDAIHSAELVETTTDGYSIKFGAIWGQVHDYTYED